jgi:hypothetical protein
MIGLKILASCLGIAVAIIGNLALAAPSEPSASGAPAKGLATPPSNSAHGGYDAGPRETPEQRTFRHQYVEETVVRERELTKHHIWTPEMWKASGNHWRRAYRTLRVRELAQDDNDAATVRRADAHLKKVTEHFLALLGELTASAPEIPAPPTVASPGPGAQLAVGSAVTFKMAPYKDATSYYCGFWQPGGHFWSNWQPSSKTYGASPECTIAADDPRWSKFQSGKAEFFGRAMLQAKSSTGKEYKMWSEPARVEVSVTGGPAPAVSGSVPIPPAKASASAGGAR